MASISAKCFSSRRVFRCIQKATVSPNILGSQLPKTVGIPKKKYITNTLLVTTSKESDEQPKSVEDNCLYFHIGFRLPPRLKSSKSKTRKRGGEGGRGG